MKAHGLIAVILLMLVLVLPPPASALTTYTLSVPNTNGFALNLQNTPPPYGYVTVQQNSSTSATITFTTPDTTYVPSNSTTYTDYYSFISTAMVGVNLNGGNDTGSNISYSGLAAYDENGTAVSTADITRAYTGSVQQNNLTYVVNVDGFGKMNLVFDGPAFAGGSGPDIDKISFDAAITGATWASEGQILVLDNAGYLAGAHLVADIYGSPGWPTDGSPAYTGFAGNGGTINQIPIPPAVLLFGSGLIGLAGLGWRRRKS
jgi:hypothetical protein